MSYPVTITFGGASVAAILAQLATLGASGQPVPFVTTGDDDEPGTASTAAFDSNGTPYDERIHSGNRTQTKSGAWQRRKGVTQADHDAIAATLPRQAPGTAPAPAPMVTAGVPMPSQQFQQPTAPAPAPMVQQPAPLQPAPMAAPAPMAQQVPVAAPVQNDPFMLFMTRLSEVTQMVNAANQPIIDVNYMSNLLNIINNSWTGHGLTAPITNIIDLQQYPAIVPWTVDYLRADLAQRGVTW